MTSNEISQILEKSGLTLQGGDVLRPIRIIDKSSDLLDLEQDIIKSVKQRGVGGVVLDSIGIRFLLGLGIGSLCIIKDPKNYLAYGMIHPDSKVNEGELVLAQVGKHTSAGFWTPDHLNPGRQNSLNVDELVKIFSALSQLATVGEHDKPNFAGVADPRHIFSTVSTLTPQTKASRLVSHNPSDDNLIHIGDDWEKRRQMVSIISADQPRDVAVLPIPTTIREPISEITADPKIAIYFPRYLVDPSALDTNKLKPLAATEQGALELLQAMAYHQMMTLQSGDQFRRVIERHQKHGSHN